MCRGVSGSNETLHKDVNNTTLAALTERRKAASGGMIKNREMVRKGELKSNRVISLLASPCSGSPQPPSSTGFQMRVCLHLKLHRGVGRLEQEIAGGESIKQSIPSHSLSDPSILSGKCLFLFIKVHQGNHTCTFDSDRAVRMSRYYGPVIFYCGILTT